MPLTESEQAQYDAMQMALLEAQETIRLIKVERDLLQRKLNRIYDIIEEDEV